MRFRWNRDVFEELRRESGIQDAVDDAADGIAEAAGEGFIVDSMQGKTRYRAIVAPQTRMAHRRNAKHNVLLKAVNARKG